jgi:hypothetical protein
MNSTSVTSRHAVRALAPIAAAIVVVVSGAAPSSARPEPGPSLPRTTDARQCTLERVGTQLVRCDDLTGNGVSAPLSVAPRADGSTS